MQSPDTGIPSTLSSPCATAVEGQGALSVGGVKYEFPTVEGTFHQAILEPNDASGCIGYVSITLSSSDGCVLQAEFTPSPQDRKLALSAMALVLPEGCGAWSGVSRGTYALSSPPSNRFVMDVTEGEVAKAES